MIRSTLTHQDIRYHLGTLIASGVVIAKTAVLYFTIGKASASVQNAVRCGKKTTIGIIADVICAENAGKKDTPGWIVNVPCAE